MIPNGIYYDVNDNVIWTLDNNNIMAYHRSDFEAFNLYERVPQNCFANKYKLDKYNPFDKYKDTTRYKKFKCITELDSLFVSSIDKEVFYIFYHHDSEDNKVSNDGIIAVVSPEGKDRYVFDALVTKAEINKCELPIDVDFVFSKCEGLNMISFDDKMRINQLKSFTLRLPNKPGMRIYNIYAENSKYSDANFNIIGCNNEIYIGNNEADPYSRVEHISRIEGFTINGGLVIHPDRLILAKVKITGGITVNLDRDQFHLANAIDSSTLSQFVRYKCFGIFESNIDRLVLNLDGKLFKEYKGVTELLITRVHILTHQVYKTRIKVKCANGNVVSQID